MKKHRTSPLLAKVLTAVAFLLAWFVLFVLIFKAYINMTYTSKLLTTIYTNLGLIVSFYVVVGIVLVLFSVWFTSHFYRER